MPNLTLDRAAEIIMELGHTTRTIEFTTRFLDFEFDRYGHLLYAWLKPEMNIFENELEPDGKHRTIRFKPNADLTAYRQALKEMPDDALFES